MVGMLISTTLTLTLPPPRPLTQHAARAWAAWGMRARCRAVVPPCRPLIMSGRPKVPLKLASKEGAP